MEASQGNSQSIKIYFASHGERRAEWPWPSFVTLILYRNTRCFYLYSRIMCINQTHAFYSIGFHPKLISRNKPRSNNLYVRSAFQPHLQFRCKTKEKSGVSLTLPYHLHRKVFYLLLSQHYTKRVGTMPILLLSSHGKYYGGNLSISWSRSFRQLYSGVNVTSWQWILEHRLRFFIDFF